MVKLEITKDGIDMGNACVWCLEDTAMGSGKFVNRIPVFTDLGSLGYDTNEDESTPVTGYGCEECYTSEE